MNIKLYRMRAGLTQQAVADKLKVTSQCVYRWESGSREPNIKTLKELARILSCTVDELVTE